MTFILKDCGHKSAKMGGAWDVTEMMYYFMALLLLFFQISPSIFTRSLTLFKIFLSSFLSFLFSLNSKFSILFLLPFLFSLFLYWLLHLNGFSLACFSEKDTSSPVIIVIANTQCFTIGFWKKFYHDSSREKKLKKHTQWFKNFLILDLYFCFILISIHTSA